MKKWFEEAAWLAQLGIGTASAALGHIILNYAKVLLIGMSKIDRVRIN